MNALMEKLRRLIGGHAATPPPAPRAGEDGPEPGEPRLYDPARHQPGPHAHMGEDGAAHPGDDPDELHRGRRRLKESHTNHWDLDYMTREEMEELAKRNRR